MLIVPELQTVFILVPRTGSGTLYREMKRVYPRAMLLYRHMEADGVPHGYDRWKRVGFVRNPLMRLLSLYAFMQTFTGGAQVQGGGASADAARIRRQVDGKIFEEWLLGNVEPWTVPYDLNGEGAYWPVLTRRHAAPENKLSQWQYLRPDLGTQILRFDDLRNHMNTWGLQPSTTANVTTTGRTDVVVSQAVDDHIRRYCSWDLEQGCKI
jgi:hypothetical protein